MKRRGICPSVTSTYYLLYNAKDGFIMNEIEDYFDSLVTEKRRALKTDGSISILHDVGV